jgi:hypothetical protein
MITLSLCVMAIATAMFVGGCAVRPMHAGWRRGLQVLGALGIAIVAASAALHAAWSAFEAHERLALVPDALEVRHIVYAKEASEGFGPGANEAGILVYALPEHIADRIEDAGPAFLNHMPDNTRPRSAAWQGRFDDWQRTPVVPDARWPAGTGRHDALVYDYVCAYGVCIDIDEAILADATSALTDTGNYVAYGRIGMLVVSPKQRRAYFLYTG